MATSSNKPEETGFPPLSYEEQELETRPLPLHELPPEVGVNHALEIIELRHKRIADGIRLFWGSPDCVEYIQKLISSGEDPSGHKRMGFKPEIITALLSLITLHEAQKRPR